MWGWWYLVQQLCEAGGVHTNLSGELFAHLCAHEHPCVHEELLHTNTLNSPFPGRMLGCGA